MADWIRLRPDETSLSIESNDFPRREGGECEGNPGGVPAHYFDRSLRLSKTRFRQSETSSDGEEVLSPPGTAADAPETAAEERVSAPEETAAGGREAASGETEAAEGGTLALWLREPGVGGISCGGWAGLGLLAGLLAALAAAAVSAWLRRRRVRPEPAQTPWSGAVTVEKLHEQGARPGQQDSFFVSPAEEAAGLLAVVADGMGGLSDGDKVSQTAVSAMAQAFYRARGTPQQVLIQLAEQANTAVNRLLGEEGLYRSGSTLTAGLIREGAFHCLSIGDSRICLYRQGTLYQLNREHVYRNELYLAYVNGEETLEGAVNHPKGAGLSSFLGMGRLKYIDLPAEPVAIRPGDRFVLMSDGVYNALTPRELTDALSREAGQTARALDEAIRAKGYQNQDNYTAVILNC